MESYLTLAVILIGFGLVLLFGEFFLPTGGLMLVAGLGLMMAAVGVVLYYGEPTEAAATVVGVCVGVPILWNVGLFVYRKSGRRLELRSESVAATVADDPELVALERLRGRVGKTVTPMRPSGSVELDGRRVDAITEGMMLAPGEWVRCVEVRAGRVVVRKIDPPGDLADMELDKLG
jgi:membrane-bound serine protease (ClpP class)